jgi:3-dehydroquinate synthase
VVIEPGALARVGELVARWAPGHRPVVITDRTVAAAVPLREQWPRLIVAPGERSKTRARWAELIDRLVEGGFGRDTVVVAVGGGMVGDLAGFVAATFLRGVPHIQVPTSLLAMVDASVGGKTGLNTPLGKNLIGAFHPPAGVLVDPTVAHTLKPAHYRSGLVEALKHGLVADRRYLRWIVRSAALLLRRDPDAVTRLVETSVAIKAAIVGRDEREQGVRAVLNAGHTVGHALEQASGYGISHGDAVARGLLVEALLAHRDGGLEREDVEAVAASLEAIGVSLSLPRGAEAAVIRAMRRDKKNRDGRIRYAPLRGIGGAAGLGGRRGAGGWTVECSESSVRQAWREARRLVASRDVHTFSTRVGRATRTRARG